MIEGCAWLQLWRLRTRDHEDEAFRFFFIKEMLRSRWQVYLLQV